MSFPWKQNHIQQCSALACNFLASRLLRNPSFRKLTPRANEPENCEFTAELQCKHLRKYAAKTRTKSRRERLNFMRPREKCGESARSGNIPRATTTSKQGKQRLVFGLTYAFAIAIALAWSKRRKWVCVSIEETWNVATLDKAKKKWAAVHFCSTFYDL